MSVLRPKEYIVYCDESVSRGAHFSNFYGGALLRSDNLDLIRFTLAAKKAELNLLGEVKWSKITENYKEKYIQLIDCWFDMVASGDIKVRIMFTQNMFGARNLTKEQRDNSYFRLYYQFIKHAFGLLHHPIAKADDTEINVRIYLDLIPDTNEKKQQFKGFLCGLGQNPAFKAAKLHILEENVTDVVSHNHDVLQCLDVVLGSMQFRLNDKHLEKPPGSRRRGRRTLAKEFVYKHINKRICMIRKNFNIGIDTGVDGDKSNRWHHPYRHWRFMPEDREIVGTSKYKSGAAPP